MVPLSLLLLACHVPNRTVIRVTTVTLLLVILSLVASVEAAGGPQQACIPAGSLLFHAFHVPTNTLEHGVNSANTAHQHSHPRAIQDIQQYPNRHLILIWFTWLILVSWLIYVKWSRYWVGTWENRTRRTSQAVAIHPHRDYGVLSGAPILVDGSSTLSKDKAQDARRISTSKGRQFCTATAPDHPTNGPFGSHAAQAASSTRENQEQFDDANTTIIIAPRSSSSRTLSVTVQAPPLHSEPLADLLSTPTETQLSSAYSNVKRACSIPLPGPSHRRTPSRYESLPHDPNYERTPPPSPEPAPLKSALYAGSTVLALSLPVQCFVLFIAVNIDREDSELNLRCFEEMLKQSTSESTSLYFESLAGPDATREKIKAKLALLYLRAGCVADDSLVLVFLTGTGDETNKMRLLNDEVVNEENIRDWVSDVRTRSGLTNVQTVPIIFDICRENENVPSANMYQIVDLMWSCSLGQRAHAIGFAPDVPNSCFLLALFWAAYDVSDSVFPDFEKTFRFRLGQLVRVRRYSHDYWAQSLGVCEECGIGSQCIPPEAQDPVGQQAGWDAVASLGALIMTRYPAYVRNIVAVLTNEMEECEKWEASQATSSTSIAQ